MENEDGVSWDHDTGEFTWNPGGHTDPPTKWGIIQEEYSSFLNRDVSPEEVKAMPRETAVAIYKKNFWLPVAGDKYLSDTSAIAIFDTAVNKGLGGCMVILTDACHQTFATRYGADTVAAVNAMPAQLFLEAMTRAVNNYITARIAKYPSAAWAEKGWRNRADRLRKLGTWSAS